MKIIILQGSPNKKGSTSILAESFTKGALEAGHEVERFDLAKMNIHPCIGCVACGYEGPCVQKDDNPGGNPGSGYGGVCDTAVLLWNVRTA